ncbi:MAG: GNAT family N-acetyltransferase [Bacteroidia bacterium]
MILRPFDSKYDNPAIIEEILSYSAAGTEDSAPSVILMQYNELTDQDLFIGSDNGVILGIAGVRYLSDGDGEIAHLAVVPEARKKGHGREIIELLMSMYGLPGLLVTAGEDISAFFEKCGFSNQGGGKWLKK